MYLPTCPGPGGYPASQPYPLPLLDFFCPPESIISFAAPNNFFAPEEILSKAPAPFFSGFLPAAAGGHAGASAYRYGMTMYALSKGYKKGERGGDGDPDPGPGEIETGAGEADTGPVPIFKDLRTKDPETGKMRRVGAKEGGSSLQAVLQNWINKNGGGFDRKALQKAVRQIVQDISKQMKANKIEIQEAVKIFENRLNLLTEAEITKK